MIIINVIISTTNNNPVSEISRTNTVANHSTVYCSSSNAGDCLPPPWGPLSYAPGPQGTHDPPPQGGGNLSQQMERKTSLNVTCRPLLWMKALFASVINKPGCTFYVISWATFIKWITKKHYNRNYGSPKNIYKIDMFKKNTTFCGENFLHDVFLYPISYDL